jgi:hypothetical protein
MRANSEAIAGTFDSWLNAEVRSSGVDNTYLDEYKTAIEGLLGGLNHKNNFLPLKHESHVNVRLPQAWQTFNMSLEDGIDSEEVDNQSAGLLFTPLMQVSGTYRGQCYLESNSGEDYLAKRHARPHGIDMEEVVAHRLNLWMPGTDKFEGAGITVDKLGKRLSRVRKIGTKAIVEACQRAERGNDVGIKESATVQVLKTAQIEWAAFATDCVVLAAKLRAGELEAVPFLQPKSISAKPPPKVVYPLDAAFKDWSISS